MYNLIASDDFYVFLTHQLADEHGVKFMETSAKSGLNVESVSATYKHMHCSLALRDCGSKYSF